jgi:diaminopimelate epimerase
MIVKNLDFEKFHGLGNDYVIINNLIWKFSDATMRSLAKILCQTHFSIGADGLIFVCSPNEGDIRMRIFNLDGSEAEMCGNGVRCFSKYVFEHQIVENERILIDTLKGMVIADLKCIHHKVETVKINMGSPILDCDLIPVDIEGLAKECVNQRIVAVDRIFEFTAVSMGNPHAIIFIDDVFSDNDLNKYGSSIEGNRMFPKHTNVEFVKMISNTEARLRVFERGVGITQSCGTGSCAAVVAGTILGRFEKKNPIRIHNDGGDLIITFDGKQVYMEGPVIRVFRGKIDELKVA